MRSLVFGGALFLWLVGCGGEQEAEVRRLRAELKQTKGERDQLRSELAGARVVPAGGKRLEPVGQPVPQASPPVFSWRRVDLPAASVEFPGLPKRGAPSFEEWQGRTGRVDQTNRLSALSGASGSVLEYTFAAGGLELAMAEVVVRGGEYLSLEERLDGFRSGVLRMGPAEIVEERSSKDGRFKTIRVELKYEEGTSAGLFAAAAKRRTNQTRFSADAVMYMAVAVWPTESNSADDARRFLDSVSLK